MKTKIYLTIFTLLMNVQFAFAQTIIYGDQTEVQIMQQECDGTCESNTSENVVFYKVDEITPNAFITGNNTKVVCKLVPIGSETKVVCSTEKPENGWGTMISDEHQAGFSYQEKHYANGADIYSIAFTDPDHGWAVGSMNEYSENSGVIFHTHDGGENWDIQFLSGTSMTLSSVSFVDPENGTAKGIREVGDARFEILLLTSDGGDTWLEQSLAQEMHIQKN